MNGGLITELDGLRRQFEMPKVSSAPYASALVMCLAKDHVTVLIDGQGGDELLGGYDVYPYVYLRKLLRHRRYRQLVVEAFRWRGVLIPLIVSRLRARFVGAPDVSLLRNTFRGQHPPAIDDRSQDNVKLRLLQDLTTYSLPPLLRYEDRISMSHAVETRLPFLDQELVAAVLRLPTSALLDHGRSRRILREALRSSLPNRIYRRVKKIGFTTPEFRWSSDEHPALKRILHSTSFTARRTGDRPAVAEASTGVRRLRPALTLLLARDQRRDLAPRLHRPVRGSHGGRGRQGGRCLVGRRRSGGGAPALDLRGDGRHDRVEVADDRVVGARPGSAPRGRC